MEDKYIERLVEVEQRTNQILNDLMIVIKE